MQSKVMFHSFFIHKLRNISWTITMYHIISMLIIRRYIPSLKWKINSSQFLIPIINAVQTWMFTIKIKMKKDKKNIMVIGNPLQIRSIDLPSNFKVHHCDINWSTTMRNLGVDLDENSTFKY